MNSRITEEFVLLVSILKWFVLATGVGILVACSTALFLTLLEQAGQLIGQYPLTVLLLPVGLAFSAWITTSIAPEAEGHGTERVIRALHTKQGIIPFKVVPAKLVATIITISVGGSAGNVGPCAQIGAALSSQVAQAFRLNDDDRKKLVICGLSAGFASVFGTPIAGALFGAEVLFVGRFLYSVFFPSVIASLTGFYVSTQLQVDHMQFPSIVPPSLDPHSFFLVTLGGLGFGLCALLFIEVLHSTNRLVRWSGLKGPLKGTIGGALLAGLGLMFSFEFLGTGYPSIQQALQGEHLLWYAFLFKILATSITLNFGGSGGIILPLCFVGATGGSLLGSLVGLDQGTFAALGMVGLLAGAANIPLTGIILAMEVFGSDIAPFAIIVCIVSYLMTGHRSVIPTQLLETTKSSSIHMDLGKEIHSSTPIVRIKYQTLTKTALALFQRKHRTKK